MKIREKINFIFYCLHCIYCLKLENLVVISWLGYIGHHKYSYTKLKINKKSKSQGGFMAVIVYLLKYLDIQLFIWWAILYATIHIF